MQRTIEEKRYYLTAPWIFQRTIKQLETVEEGVTFLLARKPHLRDCDKCLIMYYWKLIDGLHKITEDEIHRLTSSETIRRVRQHIQNDLGLWLPTEEETQEARDIKSDAIEKWTQWKKEISRK